ncbi:MAG: hypothetical protein K5921_00585 [Lachnospiraceae bacterium]|nr:hypothetical protein [Lachnospiraceae bacterium]
MIVFVCEKCKYTDLLEDTREHLCPRCGGTMLSLGMESADWNRLDGTEREAKISETIPNIVEGTFPEPIASNSADKSVDQESSKKVDSVPNASESQPVDKHKPQTGGRVKKVSVERNSINFGSERSKENPKNYSYKSFMERKMPRKKLGIKPGFVFATVMGICILLALNEQRKGNIATSVPTTPQITDASSSVPDTPVEKKAKYETYDFKNCLYYDSISDEDKEIYQIAYDLVMHKDERGYDRSITMDSFEYAQREGALFQPIHAMLADHPEFFYLQSNGRKFSCETLTIGSVRTVTFKLGEGEADENEKIKRFERATQNFMSDIDLNASDPEIEMQIHDKLIELVTYDFDLLGRDIQNGDLGFTAYGALVEDSYGLKNRAVCGGYAQAFQYLLQQAGIEAAYVTGYADSESGTLTEQGSHAWNIVKLDGEWYEVDSCWDDIDPMPNSPDKDLYKIIKYEPQYPNAIHHWFNRTTEEMNYLPAGTNTTFRVQQGNIIHELQPCAKSTHQRKRSSSDNDYDMFLYLNHYLPKATGTRYAYGN